MAGGKRKAEFSGHGAAGKKKKAYHTGASVPALPLHTRGFLVSCIAGKERQAADEAMHIIRCQHESAQGAAVAGDAERPSKDADALLREEINEIKSAKDEYFKYYKTGISGLLYITMAASAPDPGPPELLLSIAEEIQRTRQCNSRFCMRFTPVATVCQASLSDMKQAAARAVAPHFPPDAAAPSKTFAVQYDHRASASLDRTAVINAMVDCIKQPPYKANLSKPDLSIVVQVMRNVCAIGLAPRYREFAKYNFRELCNPDEEKAEGVAKAEAGAAAEPAATAVAGLAAEPDANGEKDEKTSDEKDSTGARSEPEGKDEAKATDGSPAAQQLGLAAKGEGKPGKGVSGSAE